jgi:hypothetical protein
MEMGIRVSNASLAVYVAGRCGYSVDVQRVGLPACLRASTVSRYESVTLAVSSENRFLTFVCDVQL